MHTSLRFPTRRLSLPRPRPFGSLVATFAILSLSACDSGGGAAKTSAACGAPGDDVTRQAVVEYLKLQRDPYPQRFLNPVKTDSGLPDAGVLALQDKGPTYFFPPDTASRTKIRAKLDSVGVYNTLLVAWHGAQQADPLHVTIRLSGAYIGGQHDGLKAPARAMQFACDSARWHFTKAEEEQHT